MSQNSTDLETSESDDSENYSTDSGSDWYYTEKLDEHDQQLLVEGSERAFYFESDHAALKGNQDYYDLVKTMAILQAQRIKTVEDIEKLEKLRKDVKSDPRKYLNKILTGDTSDFPSRIEVVKVPEVDWSKYSRKINEHCFTGSTKSLEMLHKKMEPPPVKMEEESSLTVRGRVYDKTKPQTFNQLWTAEEQLRLEELLLEYPPERKENSRWRKIAQALGNRTTKQVCSRVQKYFKKLKKTGLPIPGHQLKTNYMTGLKKKQRKKRKKRDSKDSTFFPTTHLGAQQLLDNENEDVTETQELSTELRAAIIKKVTLCQHEDAQTSPYFHADIQCEVCAELPLHGTRWRCMVCPKLNLCSACVINQLEPDNNIHPATHPLEPLGKSTVLHLDPDYLPETFQSTNYLDPNFLNPNV